MTNFERIKQMNEQELALFLADVSEGHLPDEFCHDFCSYRSLGDCESEFCAYPKDEYLIDYLRAEASFAL